MNQEEVVGEQTGADVTDVGEADASAHFAGGRVNVVQASI